MNIEELLSLEEKTRLIVEELEKIEKETKDFQENNFSLVESIAQISKAAGDVSKAGRALFDASQQFSSSDFAKALQEIDLRIDKINQSEVVLREHSDRLESFSEKIIEDYKSISSTISEVNDNILEIKDIKVTVNESQKLLIAMNERIGRIDRNTQKGFMKEKE